MHLGIVRSRWKDLLLAPVLMSVSLASAQTIPTITWATPASITYGTALSATQLNATASVGGTFAYSPAAGAVPVAGLDTLSVTFTPTDGADYTTATKSVSLRVLVATPTITWTQPASITVGTALSATQLDATSSTAGTFVYTPVSGTVLAAGLQTLSTTFTPTDSTDYGTVIDTVELAVTSSTSSTGAVGSIPMFIGASSFGNSIITQASGEVGIGTTSPSSPLHVEAGNDPTTGYTNCGTESATCPASATTGYGVEFDAASNNNGKYRWRFEPVDRGNNIPLYFQEARSLPNDFSNIVRFGND